MADSVYKTGDTWPPQRFVISDEDGLVDFSDADEAVVTLRDGDTVITRTAVPIDPPDDDGFNGKILWEDGDLDDVRTYQAEVKVTWDAGATPPTVQHFPNGLNTYRTIQVGPSLD